jgi:choice-of-anchor B domain-containing protein
MRKCTRGIASSIVLVSASAATSALACDGLPCLPTTCTGQFVTHLQMSKGSGLGGTLRGGGANSAAATSLNITLQSQLTLQQLGGTTADNGSSLYGWVDPLTQREYAIMGREEATSFVDITNATNPRLVATLPRVSGTVSTSWREPKVYQNTVYVGVDGTSVGMQVLDLTKLRNYAGTPITFTTSDYTVYRPTVSYTNSSGSLTSATLSKIHTLAINPDTGFLYAAGTNINGGRLHMIDVRNPNAPVSAGTVPATFDGYTHETQVVTYHGPDAQYQGHELAFNNNGSINFSILDVTNKSAVTKIASRTYTGQRYIHQGWLTEDQSYYFQNDELDEPGVAPHTRTHLWDVRDLDNPVYRGFFDNTTTSIDHNLYVKGNFVYETNYTTGLRILKIGNLQSNNPADWLQEVAYYDTYAANDGATFNGAWNNYPYFPSGNIAISDINGGLFIVRAALPGDDQHQWGLNDGIPAVPEPGSAALMAVAGGAMASGARRPRRR